jgi:hypothetical protein
VVITAIIWVTTRLLFKGSVQRKLRWVENDVNRSGVSDLAPVLLALHSKQYWRDDAPALIGEAGRFRSANIKISWIFIFAALRLLADYEL